FVSLLFLPTLTLLKGTWVSSHVFGGIDPAILLNWCRSVPFSSSDFEFVASFSSSSSSASPLIASGTAALSITTNPKFPWLTTKKSLVCGHLVPGRAASRNRNQPSPARLQVS